MPPLAACVLIGSLSVTSTDQGPQTHRDSYPGLAEWLQGADQDHWWVRLLDAPRDPHVTPPSVADMVLRPLEVLVQAVRGASARSAQFSCGRHGWRCCSTASWWRRIKISAIRHVSWRRDSYSHEAVRVIRRKTNRRHMTGDHHGQTAGTATLLVRAVDGILGTHRFLRCAWELRMCRCRCRCRAGRG
jgi:hypothetical protein